MSRGDGGAPQDQRVRDLVETNLDSSMILEAGAGTGKTTCLVSRVVTMLKTEACSLDRIAIITFTEKAAGELKVKVREGIEKEIATLIPTATRWEGLLREALATIDRAPIMTIHSFAAQLLRERPVEADVDPRFSVAEALAASMLMEETWDTWLSAEMAATDGPLREALEAGVTLSQLKDLAESLTEQRDASLDPRDILAQEREVLIEVPRAIRSLDTLVASCRDEDDGACKLIRHLMNRDGLNSCLTLPVTIERLRAIGATSRLGAASNWDPPATLKEARELLSRLTDLRAMAESILALRVGRWITDGFLTAFRLAKERRRLLDFGDLLLKCRDMLRDNQAARSWCQKRFQTLLVDEFQDTDPLQAEIIFLLASDDADQSDWRQCTPRPGSLFVVGDLKQSIYRFRRADPQICEDVRDRLPRTIDGVDLVLTTNFRTVPSIVEWVNALFSKLIVSQPEMPNAQPPYQAIAAYRAEPGAPADAGPNGAPRVRLLMPKSAGSLGDGKAGAVRRAEAVHVAGLLLDAKKNSWLVAEAKKKSRPMQWNDMALLFRTGSAFEIYEEALREASVPYRIEGGRRYYVRAETRALQAVLQAIDSPQDPVATVSALRSSIFGHSDEELVAHSASGRGWIYTRADAGTGTPFEKSFELLARLHGARQGRSRCATIEDLLDVTGFLSLCFLRPDGEQRAANLLKALDLARAHDAAGVGTFGSFVRWFLAMAAEGQHEREAPVVEEAEGERSDPDAQAIRLMTIHKAKGLEFPLVVLCDAGGQTRGPGGIGCVVEREAGSGIASTRLEFKLGPKERSIRTPGWEAASEREAIRLSAELERLFYVAATRARDYLILPVFEGNRVDWIYKRLQEKNFLPKTGAPDGVTVEGARVCIQPAPEFAAEASASFRLPIAEPRPTDPSLTLAKDGWRMALRAALAAPTMGRVFRTASGLELAPELVRSQPRHDAAVARGVGKAVHGVLERIDLSTGRDIGLLSEEEADLAGVADRAHEVRVLVQSALASPIVKQANAAPRLFREMPFAATGESWITEGRIDLAFEEGGALTIVDFKTDAVNTEEEAAARTRVYRPQALVYATALADITGRPVRRVVFHFVRPGLTCVVPIDESALVAGRRLLETGNEMPVG